MNEVGSTPDVIVLFDAKGRSVWSSSDLSYHSRTEWNGSAVLRMHLCRALRSLMPRMEDAEAICPELAAPVQVPLPVPLLPQVDLPPLLPGLPGISLG